MNSENDNKLANLLRTLLKSKHMTQGQLAILAGLKRDDIKSIVTGKSKNPRADKLDKISSALKIDSSQLREAAGYIPETIKPVESYDDLWERLSLMRPHAIPVYSHYLPVASPCSFFFMYMISVTT